MTGRRPVAAARRALLALAVAGLAACGARGVRAPAGGDGDLGACARIQAVRQVRGEAVCEDAWTCSRPPNGEWDRVGIRRVALCDGADGPIVLYLPGMHMNAELPGTDARSDLRLHLALAGHRAWGLDWRPHAVNELASQAALGALAAWDRRVFVEDAAWAMRFVRGAEQGPIVLAGFSYGAGIAYEVAARGDASLAGLVILDGAPASGDRPRSEGPVVDAGSSRLPWDVRQRLLATVVADPGAASPLPGHRTAGAALADVLWTSAAFGGNGGLSAARDGVSDVQVLARLLETYDRWWPSAALGGSPPDPPDRPLRVLAFAAGNLGPAWATRVRAGAHAFGGDRAVVHDLPLHGHLDVLVGRLAAEMVYEPVRRFAEQ